MGAGIVLLGILAGCGGSDPITLPSRVTEASTSTVVTTTSERSAATVPGVTGGPDATSAPTAPTVVAASEWVPAVGNLEGMASECGNLAYVAADPDRDVVVAGVALDGLYQSVDGSPTWEPLGGGGGAPIQNRTASITFDPSDDQTFWESGHYAGGGAFRTTDGGATFEQLGDLIHLDVLSVDLSDPARQTMLVGKHEQSQLLRSTDGGETWADVQGLPAGIGYAAFPLVLDAETHLLGTYYGESSGIFRSADGGATWTKVFDRGVAGAPLLTADGRIYWIPEGGGSIVESTDQGVTWTEMPGPLRSTWTGVRELPDGRLIALSDDHVVVSDAAGAVWQPVGPPLPYEPVGFTYAPLRNAVYVWRFDCGEGNVPVAADAIMRLDADLG